MFTTSALLECGNTIPPMLHTKPWLQCSHTPIELISTHNIDYPLQWVVEKEFVKCVKGIGSQEFGRVGMTPVPPKWLMNTIKSKTLTGLIEGSNSNWVCRRACQSNEI